MQMQMQKIFNYCHGMFETHAGRWICSVQSSEGSGTVDEEIIGDESPAYKPHVQSVEESQSKGMINPLGLQGQRGPAAPIGHRQEEQGETSKVRLQRLIRDFAHDAVGPGLPVEAATMAAGAGTGGSGPLNTIQVLLRMDRRLSRIELWPCNMPEGTEATYSVPLQQVATLIKGVRAAGESPEPSPEPSPAIVESGKEMQSLTVEQRNGPDLRIIFESTDKRDRAFTCLRIFQMSVDPAAGDGQEAESELAGSVAGSPYHPPTAISPSGAGSP